MSEITITVPASVSSEVTEIMQSDLAADSGPSVLTERALLTAWLRQMLGPRLKARRRGAIDDSAVVAAREAAEAALATEEASRATAVATAEAGADTDIAGVV